MKDQFLIGLIIGILVCIAGLASADTIVSQDLGNNAYTASSSYDDRCMPVKAFDGYFDANNSWNSGTWPVSWIEVNLGQSYYVTNILLSVEQYPTSALTTHQVWSSSFSIGENLSGANLSYTFSGNTYDGQLLSADFSPYLKAQYIQIRTTYSPSWVSWNEIQIRATASDTIPEPASLFLFGIGILGLTGVARKKGV